MPNALAVKFSGATEEYIDARPDYPATLYNAIVRLIPTPSREKATIIWDCATGPNAGVVSSLSQHNFPACFSSIRVHATDYDPATLQSGQAHYERSATPRGLFRASFSKAAAEVGPPLGQGEKLSATLVGNALHWFDDIMFFQAVHRASKKDALFAAWTHKLEPTIPECGALQRAVWVLAESLRPFEEPRCRDYVTGGYNNLGVFPFREELFLGAHTIRKAMNLETFGAYYRSLLTGARYEQATGQDVRKLVHDHLGKVWSHPSRTVTCEWNVDVRAARVGSYNGPV